jgi:MFS transporter, FHS family, L-fucose permease
MQASGGTAPAVDAGDTPTASGALTPFLYALFFIWGGITSLNDVLIPKLKGLFHLNYGEAMLVQSAFFLSYLLFSLPAGYLVARLGYMRSAVIGLLTMAVGAALFFPAAKLGMFVAFLPALFVVAGGITIVQVVANPLVSLLGKPQLASSRLTFAQAFNSLGTALFPLVGSILILGSAGAGVAGLTYLGIAGALLVVAAAVFLQRNQLHQRLENAPDPLAAFALLKQPHFAFGALCIFVYVGAEVSIGSLIVSFLSQPSKLGISTLDAGKHIWIYWTGAMIGRFAGAFILRKVSPGLALTVAALVNILLLASAALVSGLLGGWSLLAIGLFNSIMFPTIFSVALERLGKRTPEGSGILCMAIVGGAVIPLLTGKTADAVGLSMALAIPAVCYAVIAGFGWYARRPLEAPIAS